MGNLRILTSLLSLFLAATTLAIDEPDLSNLTNAEKRKVQVILDRLHADGFESIRDPDISFAFSNTFVKKVLLPELKMAAVNKPDSLTVKARKTLKLDQNKTILFAIKLSRRDKLKTLSIAQTLNDRDRSLTDKEIEFIRSGEFLQGKFAQYKELGLDPVKVAARQKREVDELTRSKAVAAESVAIDLKIEIARLSELKAEQAKLTAEVKSMSLQLARINQSANPNEKVRDKLSDQLSDAESRLSDCLREIEQSKDKMIQQMQLSGDAK